ncbi:hypothetical protein QQF64_035280 [Cirrhinus molitorella]|uniref:Uncharacterized protein n=1 Tax=Cirrhinus molitorella TaxID=172907 RepID=A0ABR3NFB8_9TELE
MSLSRALEKSEGLVGSPPATEPNGIQMRRCTCSGWRENGLACGTLWKALSKHDPIVTPTAHGPCRSQTGPLSLFRYPGADLLHFKLNHHPQSRCCIQAPKAFTIAS